MAFGQLTCSIRQEYSVTMCSPQGHDGEAWIFGATAASIPRVSTVAPPDRTGLWRWHAPPEPLRRWPTIWAWWLQATGERCSAV